MWVGRCWDLSTTRCVIIWKALVASRDAYMQMCNTHMHTHTHTCHLQFETFDGTFYALFTMLNGDDLWNTYTGITPLDDAGVYVFSQIFFTIFLMLFIYAVLNLFISLIIESYEYSQVGIPWGEGQG